MEQVITLQAKLNPTKEQIKLINADCNCKFSVVTENGAVFFKK